MDENFHSQKIDLHEKNIHIIVFLIFLVYIYRKQTIQNLTKKIKYKKMTSLSV